MIDATFCNSLLTQTTSATFTWQIGGMRQNILNDRFRYRDVAADKALRAVTLLIAELTGLNFGSAIRCGELPASVSEGYAVSLVGNGKREIFDATPWNVLFYARGKTAETLLGTAEKLAAKLPLPLPVTVQDGILTSRIAIHQLNCGKMRLESVGARGCAPYALTVELTTDIAKGI